MGHPGASDLSPRFPLDWRSSQMFHSSTRLFSLIGCLLLPSFATSSVSAPAHTDCDGCEPVGGGGSTAWNVTQTHFVKIDVTITSGVCLENKETGACVGSPCSATVTRTWDLPSGTEMGFCSQIAGRPKTCRDPKPKAGTATSPDIEGPNDVGCGVPEITYSIGVSFGSAGSVVSCTDCD